MSDGLGLDDGSMDIITLHSGVVMQVHGPARCAGTTCCIHNPSNHPLHDRPMIWLRDLNLMLRICECGAAHPDPDSMAFLTVMSFAGLAPWYDGWHPCCPLRCCEDPSEPAAADADVA